MLWQCIVHTSSETIDMSKYYFFYITKRVNQKKQYFSCGVQSLTTDGLVG